MLNKNEALMKPYALFPPTNKRVIFSHSGVFMGLGIAVHKAVGAIEAAWNWIDRWHARDKSIRELSRLDDHMLKDIGLHRGEIREVVESMLNASSIRPVASWPAIKAGPAAPPRSAAAANDNKLVIAAGNCS